MKKYLILFIILIFNGFIYAQDEPETYIHGVVTDEYNSPLPGASLLIQETDIGTITDIDGEFEFNLLGKYDYVVVEISYVGFETQTAIVGFSENKELNISLKEFKFTFIERYFHFRWYGAKGWVFISLILSIALLIILIRLSNKAYNIKYSILLKIIIIASIVLNGGVLILRYFLW